MGALKIKEKLLRDIDIEVDTYLDAYSQSLLLFFECILNVKSLNTKSFVFSTFYFQRVDWYLKSRIRLMDETKPYVKYYFKDKENLDFDTINYAEYKNNEAGYVGWAGIYDNLDDSTFNDFRRLLNSNETKKRFINKTFSQYKQKNYSQSLGIVLQNYNESFI
jgi:hypothetical protein